MNNPVTFAFSCFFVLLAHAAMLVNVFVNGSYSSLAQPIVLACAVAILDVSYFVVVMLFRQTSYTIDFLLVLVLNMGVIFQSCFGGVQLNVKHYITAVAALAACRGGFVLCRNYKWIQAKRKFIYIAIGVCILLILTLTGSRSMWISIGSSFTIQPSELIKQLFVLA